MVENVVFAQKSDLCGVGVFTTDHLVCSKLGPEEGSYISETVAKEIKAIAAPVVIDRGFGLELEFVGRRIPEDLKEHVI